MGVVKKGQYKVHNGTDYDTIHFETESSMIVDKGVANGVASLDGSGKVPSGQLPTTVAAHKASHSIGGADALIDADIGVSPDVASALGLDGNVQVKDALEIIAANLIQSPPLYPKELLNLSNQSLSANTLKSFTLTDNLKNYDLIYISVSTSAPEESTNNVSLWFDSTKVPGASTRTNYNNLLNLVIYRNKSELVSGTGLVPCVYSNYSEASILSFNASLLNTNMVGLQSKNDKDGISISVRGVML